MILYIKQAGFEIFHRGKILRTPVKLKIKQSDISHYEKMMKFKSIRNYDIIDTEDTQPMIQTIAPRRPMIDTKSDSFVQQNIHMKKIDHMGKTRVMEKIQTVKKKQNFDQKETGYHDSIESGIDLNIDVDIDSDDILKQLLSNI